MLEQRMKAKRSGDKSTANALKLVANTTYGAMLNKYNDLYDPLRGRSVCITGQLFLLELANHLKKDCETLFVIQLNTDGIMVSFDDSEYDKVLAIIDEWQQRTGFELEEMAMVGDRLYTDVATGVNHGMTGILVLSGEATMQTVEESDVEPHLIFGKLADMIPYL